MSTKLKAKTKTWIALLVAVVCVVTVTIVTQWRSEEESFLSNLALFSLMNLNILALLVLIVLVARNVIKLIFERKRGILGAKLRSRLVGSFVLIALIPMSLSFLVASGLINQAMQGWFNTQVESIVNSSLAIAKQYVSQAKLNVSAAAAKAHLTLRSEQRVEGFDTPVGLKKLERLRDENDLYSLKVINRDGTVRAEASHATAQVESFAEPPLDRDAARQASADKPLLRIEELGASQFIRVYQALGEEVLVSSYRMDPEMVNAQAEIYDAYNEYGDIKNVKDPLRDNFFIILALSNLLTLFGAIWIAFFISKQITGPIQALAEGTRRIARGQYGFTLPPPTRDDEIGYLVAQFNQMVGDLTASRNEAERRGSLIEAILTNLGVGVIALDPELRVTAVNPAARNLLDIEPTTIINEGQPLPTLLSTESYREIAPIIESVSSTTEQRPATSAAEAEVRLRSSGRQLIIICTAGRITNTEGEPIGYVLLLDDVTELSRSQHLAAWRDVARRIAHEIKNPLTPLQLSAQRLEKLLSGKDAQPAITESTRSIVEHVEIIKKLANEFSEYGRMPTAQFVPTDLEALLRNTFNTFKQNNPEIKFSYDLLGKTPEMLLDPEQIRGVFINIYANAIAAVKSLSETDRREIHTTLDFNRALSRATVSIADTGTGIPTPDKHRVFEPYFTTKKGGTGLGLAIVSSVISDHQGEITVFDNPPRGARFVINLPQYPHVTTTRRLGG
jgi:two-component system nitrogen regulation sensor histidine kinase NtrY